MAMTAASGVSSAAEKSTTAHVVWASALGTAIEWYDFLIYGTAAALVLNKLFFPSFDPFVGTLAAFSTYAVGFVARPIGGAIIGHYGDRLGRKKMLGAPLIAVGPGTVLVGCLPTHSPIRGWAPIFLVLFRFVLGVGAPISLVILRFARAMGPGGEGSGAVVMVPDHAGNRRGFYGSLVQIGFPVGVAASTGIFGLMTQLPEADFLSWGWRVPFLISILLVGVGFIVRLKLAETPHFKEVLERKEVLAQPALEVLRRDWRSFLLAIGITVSEVGLAYLLTVFTVVYATTQLGLPRQVILNAVVYAALVELATLPLAGWLSDLFGRKALYLAGGVFSVALAFPLFWFLDTREPALITLALVVTMTLTHALLFGPKAAFMPELFRTQVRYSGASLGANVAAALSGGFSPLIATALLAWAGSYWAVSVYIVALSVITSIATLIAPETARDQLRS